MWPNPQETADLVTFTEEIYNGKFHFLCSGNGQEEHYLDTEFMISFPFILQAVAKTSGA